MDDRFIFPEPGSESGREVELFNGLPATEIDMMEPLKLIEHMENAMFSKAMQEAYLNPNGKLGQKIMEKIVDRQFDRADDSRRNEADKYFQELNKFDEATLEKLERGEIAADELVFDEKSGVYVLAKDTEFDVLEVVDEEDIPNAIPVDDIGDTTYDPDAWGDEDDVELLIDPEGDNEAY
jgi:hypothetical protein